MKMLARKAHEQESRHSTGDSYKKPGGAGLLAFAI